MLTKRTIFLLAAAAALMGCANVPSSTPGLSNSPGSKSAAPRDLLAEAIAARQMTFASSARTAMEQAYREKQRLGAGRQGGGASSPAEIHAAFEAWSKGRATVHPVPIARMVREAQVTQARLEVERTARALDEVADSSVARMHAQIYRVFASWPERRASVEADPARRTRILGAAAATTSAQFCGLINTRFVEVAYGAEVACATPGAPNAGIEVTVAY